MRSQSVIYYAQIAHAYRRHVNEELRDRLHAKAATAFSAS